jgi:photosystem II stability/assembly factor-like uncharacterized protein
MNKTLLITILLLVAGLNAAFPQNTMWIDTLGGKPGDTLTYSVKVDNVKPFVAFQLDIQIPAQLTYLLNSAALTSRANGHSLAVSLINANTIRALAYSTTMTPFNGSTGAVMTFGMIILGTTPGNYNIPVVGPIISDSLNLNILTASYGGRLIIQLPKINFNTGSIDLGRTLLGTNKDFTLNISNGGTTNLIVSRLSSISTNIRFLDSSGFTLTPGANINRTVRLYADSKGLKTATLKIYSNDPYDSVHSIPAQGTVYTTNELYLNTITLKYGFSGTIKIRMKNFEPVNAFQLSVTLPSSVNYNAGSIVLNPARKTDHIINASVLTGNVLRIISYSPTNAAYLGNDSTIAEFSIRAIGNPGGYSLPVSGGVISDTSGSNILSDVFGGSVTIISPVINLPASILFDTISALDTNRKTLAIRNNGTDTLKISGISCSNSSFVNETSLPVYIAPNVTSNFSVRFSNPNRGLQTGNLIISHNDSLRNPGQVPVSGYVYKINRMAVHSPDFNSRDTAFLPFDLNNAESVVAFQFDVTLPPQAVYMPGTVTLTPRANGHTVSASVLGNGDIRIIAYSMTMTPFSGTSGEIVKFKVAMNADTGVYNVSIKNIIISDSNNVNISSGLTNGFIRVSPLPPLLVSPVNGSVGNQVDLNLLWMRSQFASGYHLQVAMDSLFANKVINDSTRTDTTYSLNNLSILQNYFWRVRVKNYSGIYRFSDYWRFKTIGFPTQVVLSSPANNAVNQPLNITFKWFKAIDQTLKPRFVSNYWFELASDSLFANIIETDSTLTDTTKTVTGIADLSKYFWRVKAKNIFGWGSFSNIWNFTIGDYSGQWVQVSGGIGSDKAIQAFAVIGNKIFTGTYGNSPGVFVSTNKGASWTSVSNGLPPNPSVFTLCAFGNNLFVGTIGNGGYISTNFGSNWIQVTNGLSDPKILTSAYNGTTLFAGTYDNGVYRSTDNGASWSNCLSVNRDYALTVKDNFVFVGSINGSVYRSSNNGINWVSCNNGTSGEKFELYGSGENLYLGTRPNGVFRSVNNGDNWTQINSGLTNTTVYALASIGSNVLAGTPSGAFLSTNYGGNWVQINQGFTSTPEIDQYLIYDDYIYAGTAGYSSWRRALSTLIVPDAPSLISPANLTTGNPVNLNLVWIKSKYATFYNLVLATDSLFSNIVLNDSTLTDSVKTINNLTPLTNYYWKVRAKNNVGWSSFSSFYNFKTIGTASQVVLSTPPNNAVNQSVDILFKWFKAVDLTLEPLLVSNYWFELASDSVFTNIVLKDTLLTDTLKSTTASLNFNTSYYWRVKAKNQIGWGAFSSIWKFTTYLPVPAAPVLVSPANNSADLSQTPLLDWNDVTFASGYRVQVSTSSAFTTTVYDTIGLTVSQITVPSGKLTTNTLYYWRVSASNTSGTSSYSSVWNFSTAPNAPNVPVLSQPANGSTGQPTTITFVWYKAIETLQDNSGKKGNETDDIRTINKYWFEYSTDSAFTTVVLRDTLLTASDTSKTISGLSNLTKYFWRVKAKNQTGWGNFSAVWNFTTLIPIPSAPVLLLPANNSLGISLTPLLDWNDAQYASGYRVQVSADSLFSTTLWDTSSVVPSQVTVPSGKLTGLTKYYWRVNATNAAGTGSWSAVWNFRTVQNLTLNLKVYLEGFWDGSSHVPDTVFVYLANTTTPFAFTDTAKVVLSATGTAPVTFTKAPNGSYHIVVIHRNHLETWSKLGQSFVTNVAVNYDFTTAASQAYGDNMKQFGSAWVFYGGDPNMDGSIDGIDIALFINEFGLQGYLSCDFNGDGDVNAMDVQIIINNFGLTKSVPSFDFSSPSNSRNIEEEIKVLNTKINKQKSKNNK